MHGPSVYPRRHIGAARKPPTLKNSVAFQQCVANLTLAVDPGCIRPSLPARCALVLVCHTIPIYMPFAENDFGSYSVWNPARSIGRKRDIHRCVLSSSG